MELIFEEPSETRGRPVDPNNPFAVWLAALREHPGQWAKFPTEQLTAGSVSNIKKGKYHGTTAGEYEVKSRKATNNRHWIFARYVGES